MAKVVVEEEEVGAGAVMVAIMVEEATTVDMAEDMAVMMEVTSSIDWLTFLLTIIIKNQEEIRTPMDFPSCAM